MSIILTFPANRNAANEHGGWNFQANANGVLFAVSTTRELLQDLAPSQRMAGSDALYHLHQSRLEAMAQAKFNRDGLPKDGILYLTKADL